VIEFLQNGELYVIKNCRLPEVNISLTLFMIFFRCVAKSNEHVFTLITDYTSANFVC